MAKGVKYRKKKVLKEGLVYGIAILFDVLGFLVFDDRAPWEAQQPSGKDNKDLGSNAWPS